jgi:hypothetical protein
VILATLIAAPRRLPGYGWTGLALMLVSEGGMLAGIPPFTVWHTPIAWTGYILLVDGFVWKRRGSSWIRNAPAELAFLAILSVPLWVIFEVYNAYSLRNWYYAGLPENALVRYVGYVWAFATISPAIFETAELVGSLRDRPAPDDRAVPRRPIPVSGPMVLSVVAGAAMLIAPIVYPSAYLAAPVFLGFIFLLDPLNARAGGESMTGDWRLTRYDRLVNLLVAGLVCGLVWEFWNYWARAKWIYTVPILPEVKLFEMPILGFGGFPPFAVECFTMYVTARHLLWRGAQRPIAL